MVSQLCCFFPHTFPPKIILPLDSKGGRKFADNMIRKGAWAQAKKMVHGDSVW